MRFTIVFGSVRSLDLFSCTYHELVGVLLNWLGMTGFHGYWLDFLISIGVQIDSSCVQSIIHFESFDHQLIQ